MTGKYAPPFAAGDMIGFSGRGFVSDTINLATFGLPRWGLSHVAVVGPRQGRCRLVLWESTGLCELVCLIHNRTLTGVQAHGIQERIENYDGRVWHFPLRHRLDLDQIALLGRFLEAHQNDTYDTIEAFRARQTPLSWIERRLSRESWHSLFCSELVAKAWDECGVWEAKDCRFNPNRLKRLAMARPYAIVEEKWRLK